MIVHVVYDGREFGEIGFYEVSENLTEEMVSELNKQKYTCQAVEKSQILILNKKKTNEILNEGLQSEFEKRIKFLQTVEIFQNLDINVLLPLANNLITLNYKLGDFILKEGELSKGLYVLYKG
eukprot:CAMPEP_0170554328 /NCGR_PEP_ID=MMETSP0211-20121228/12170_1 /TAXON_ID=311385 /ORGANISM="Pseudokeronopsis sp., Strain OXSARD2" /LENGTH=122 /DNA_ID=CAMNT_0010863283 /DNA_START=1427 /DNA_END=1795 /DNA_ORIENTATION=+